MQVWGGYTWAPFRGHILASLMHQSTPWGWGKLLGAPPALAQTPSYWVPINGMPQLFAPTALKSRQSKHACPSPYMGDHCLSRKDQDHGARGYVCPQLGPHSFHGFFPHTSWPRSMPCGSDVHVSSVYACTIVWPALGGFSHSCHTHCSIW